MQKVLTAEQMREVDRLTTERYGIPSILLMENAAHAVARVITEKLGGSVKGKSVLILCGKGNNGGDGAALARVLFVAGAVVQVVLFGKVDELKGDSRTNFDYLLALREGNNHFSNPPFDKFDQGFISLHEVSDGQEFRKRFRCHRDPQVVVDAIFGTGLSRAVDENLTQVIHSRWLAEKGDREDDYLLLSLDMPSGLRADFPCLIGSNVQADMTVTFTAPKSANILSPSAALNGDLVVANIGTPADLVNSTESDLYVSESEDLRDWLKYGTPFESASYKNKRGHALIIAGSEDYSGAAVMCGNSAMRSGVGLTTLLVPASCKVEVASRVIPEVIVRAIGETDGEVSSDAFAANENVICQADSILVGPGLKATDQGVENFVREIVSTRTVPVILDAGALWFCNPPDGLLKAQADATRAGARAENHPVGETPPPLLRREGSLILTPHEGEFMRLLGTDDKDAIKDRVAAVRDFSVANNVILVLKGERVLIGSPDGRVVVNPTGNSGLGKAGNGDTLAGILAGFVAQAVKFEIDIFETVVAAVYVAGMAGDVAERKYGKRVMTASDVRECLTEVFVELEGK